MKEQNQSSEGVETEKKNTSDCDDHDFNPSKLSAYGSRNSDEKPSSSDDIKAWNTANEQLFSVLRLTITGAAYSVLLKFELRTGKPGNGRETKLALKNKYHNTSRQRRDTAVAFR